MQTLKALVLTALFLSPAQSALAVKGDEGAAAEAWVLIAGGALVVDVRSAEEFEAGHLEGAINIPHTETEALIEAIGEESSRQVVMYCGSGRRVELAKQALETHGYTGVFNASGLEALEATRPKP